MFKLFRKKKVPELYTYQKVDKAASLIAKGFIRIQTAWANWMSSKEKKLTIRQKKIALVIFCISTSILPCSILYNGIFKNQSAPSWLKPPSVTLPEDTRLPDSLNMDYLRELYKQRQAERYQIDSTHN